MKWNLFRGLSRRHASTNDSKKENAEVEQAPAIRKDTHATTMAKRFFEAVSACDEEAVKSLASDRCIVNFVQANTEMPLDEYLESVRDLIASFPDFELMARKFSKEKMFIIQKLMICQYLQEQEVKSN